MAQRECAARGCSDAADWCTSRLNPANGECEADFNFLLKGSYWPLKQLLHVPSTIKRSTIIQSSLSLGV